jgi:nucleotide-binding universal stress UspA family protein
MYFSPLMLPYDGSAASAHALRHVVENLRGTAAQVMLVNVQPPLIHEPELMGLGPALARAERKEGEKVLAPARAILQEAGLDHTAEVAFGEPAEVIARMAEAGGSRLVVVGASRRRSIADYLRASLVSRLLAISAVPVTIVREPARPGDGTRRRDNFAFLAA